MTTKQKKISKICFIIFIVSMAVMAVATVIQIIHNGWESISPISFLPFIGGIAVFTTVFAGDKKKDDRQ